MNLILVVTWRDELNMHATCSRNDGEDRAEGWEWQHGTELFDIILPKAHGRAGYQIDLQVHGDRWISCASKSRAAGQWEQGNYLCRKHKGKHKNARKMHCPERSVGTIIAIAGKIRGWFYLESVVALVGFGCRSLKVACNRKLDSHRLGKASTQ